MDGLQLFHLFGPGFPLSLSRLLSLPVALYVLVVSIVFGYVPFSFAVSVSLPQLVSHCNYTLHSPECLKWLC